MRKKKPFVAKMHEVKISRNGEEAIIAYTDPDVAVTHLQIGPEISAMSDADILELFNQTLRAQEALAANFEHVPVEIPPGSPQIKYLANANQWVPRGDVVRCLIEDDENGEAVIVIDNQELTLAEFGRLLTTHAGWGMRIIFLPDDALPENLKIEVREPDDEPIA